MIKVSQGCLGEAELAAIRAVFPEGYFGHSVPTVEFERELSAFLGDKTVVAVNTGTTALHLALDALGTGPGDEVIVPSLTFVGAFQAIAMTGAKPVACEIDPATLCIDVEDAIRRVSAKTKAIMPMHYAGQACDMDALLRFRQKTGIRIVEDAAHAFGSTYHGKRIGSFGDVTCFSFDSIKNITCGEGGAIACADEDLAETMRVKRHVGIRPKPGTHAPRHSAYEVKTLGYRYHMNALNAAIGLVQLKRFPEFANRRREICRRYVEALKNVPSIALIPTDYDEVVPHVFVIRVKGGRRDGLAEFLRSQEIETGLNYLPNHTLELFKSDEPLQVTEEAWREILTLPLHCRMGEGDVEKVICNIKTYFL